jgi:glyoxylase-like metal-dependent hydrolase (beta-lactamase superfamily II)
VSDASISTALINHGHEWTFGPPAIAAPVFVHERDRAELGTAIPVAGTFSGPETIGTGLDVIPTPRHTTGSSCSAATRALAAASARPSTSFV